MTMSLMPSAISAGASMFGSILGAASARANNKLQQKAMELQDYQFRNKTQIRMEDYKKAGINPILAGLDGGAVPAYNMNGLQNVGEQLRQGATDIGNLAANLYNAKEARKIQEKDLENKYIVQEQQAKQAVQQTHLLREQARLAKNENNAMEQTKVYTKSPISVTAKHYALPKVTSTGENIKVMGFGYGHNKSEQDYVLYPEKQSALSVKQLAELAKSGKVTYKQPKKRPVGMYGRN